MAVLGYAGAVLMGLLLGLLGGGGSILTVPLLAYVFGIDAPRATAYSLVIVGTTALVACLDHWRAGNLDRRAGLLFGAPGVLAVMATRRFVVPALPDPLFATDHFVLTKNAGMLAFLAVLMLLTARHMLRKRDLERASEEAVPRVNEPLLMLRGALTGAVTSLVGAGGGFLIVPALVVFAKLPMRRAVGTSLPIIAANGLFGAAIDPHLHSGVDVPFLLLFTGLAVAGSLAGARLGRRVPQAVLRPAFGWFVLAMGLMILVRELG